MTTGKATFRASNSPQGLTENMQILTGQKGDRLDKALTLREAAAIGMVNLRRNGSGQIVPELPPATSGDPEWSGVQQPVAPTGVTVDGAFHAVTLTWDAPAYNGHAFAEVWRAQENNLAKAVRVGTTLANVYSDAVGKGFKAFYWVRFVNKNAFAGPYQSTGGIPAETSRDVDSIIASANNFAIYNPAKPDQKEIIFGVTDDGKVAIREAVIKAATIQILTSEKITADYVKAGVSISSPLISGGQIDMGNAYFEGGNAAFGLGGQYQAWGKGWNTVIYADGSIYTNRLRAEGGYVKNMTMNNCTIEQDCVVRGTVYAERIQGDVAATRSLPNNGALTVLPSVYVRKIYVSTFIAAGRYGSHINILVNGISIGRLSVSPLLGGQTGAIADMKSAVFTYTIPANVQVTISSSANIPDFSTATALVTVQKQDSSTFA